MNRPNRPAPEPDRDKAGEAARDERDRAGTSGAHAKVPIDFDTAHDRAS
jgi:hypothetical protein